MPKLPKNARTLPTVLGRSKSNRYALPVFSTIGTGRNGSSTLPTATGPAPGPPPPCGVVKVLCRLMCRQSTPWSPGRNRPRSAFRLAPSMYTSPPAACTTAAISSIFSSNRPSVDGLVIMMPATSSRAAALAVPRADHHEAGQLTVRARGRLQGRPRQPRDLAQRALEGVHERERPLQVRLGRGRMQGRKAGQPGRALVDLGVVLHG